jgi:Domain of unknown function (DUF5076)
MENSNQLEIPGPAMEDSGSFEILRVWVAKNSQQVSVRTGVWEDPAAWGLLLADLMRHVACSYQLQSASDRKEVLERIKSGLLAELNNPTDEPPSQL